jgi:hypothetical protein
MSDMRRRFAAERVNELLNLHSELSPEERSRYTHLINHIASLRLRGRIQTYLEHHPEVRWTNAQEGLRVLGTAISSTGE